MTKRLCMKSRIKIQVLFEQGKSISDIASELRITLRTVYKWSKRENMNDIPRRKTVVNKDIKDKICQAKGKIGYSSRLMALELNKEFHVDISHTKVNKLMNDLIGKPYKVQNTYKLSKFDKARRLEFAMYIKDNNIKGTEIMFSDEKLFMYSNKLNSQTSRVRCGNEASKEEINELKYNEEKKPLSIIIAYRIFFVSSSYHP